MNLPDSNKKDRHLHLLELLPKHDWKIAPAAIEAGFSQSTAYKQAKSLLQTALKKQSQLHEMQRLAMANNKETKASEIVEVLKQQTLAEKIGMTSEMVKERLVYIATQERDLNAALKVLTPLSKDIGIDIGLEESQKTIVPVLNVTVKEKNMAQPSHIIDNPPM